MRLIYLKNVVTLKLDPDKCIGCGMCVAVCPHGVFDLDHNKAKIIARDMCMECGACAKNCPASAVVVRSGVGCASFVMNSKSKRNDAGDDGCSCGDSGCC